MDDGHPAFPFRDSDAGVLLIRLDWMTRASLVIRGVGTMVAWWARVAWLADSRLERLTSPMISPSMVRAPRIFADGECRLESTDGAEETFVISKHTQPSRPASLPEGVLGG